MTKRIPQPSVRSAQLPNLTEMCRSLADRSPDPTAAVDGVTHHICYANSAFQNLVGIVEKELLSKNLEEVLPKGMAEGSSDALRRVWAAGAHERLDGHEPGVVGKGIPYSHWSLGMWTILGTGDELAGILVQVADLSGTALFRQQSMEINEALLISSLREHELRELADTTSGRLRIDVQERIKAQLDLQRSSILLESRVRERTAQLAESNRDLKGFAYSIAHTLRAPLRAILTTSQALQDDLVGRLRPPEQEALNRQVFNGRKLASLIDDLLLYARLTSEPLRRVAIDLSLMANEMAADLSVRYPDRTFELVVEKGLIATADRTAVKVLMSRLIDNAAKFSPDGGRIVVGQVPIGGPFFVKDEGIGFDLAHTKRLFEPFERLVGDLEFPGNGIGLAKVRRVAERHGGKAWAESQKGHGATFFFTLSSAEAEHNEPD